MSAVEELEQLRSEAISSIDQAHSSDELERLRVKFLGRKSRLTDILKSIPQLPADQRSTVGKHANQLKHTIESQLAARRELLAATPAGLTLDVSLPGSAVVQGRLHPITQTLHAILSALSPLGFEIVEGPEMEFEYYNFDALNIPSQHPSRDAFDTFYLDEPSPQPKKGALLLRSHTSPVQVRVMELRQPPVRVVVPGRVFRPDAVDASHSFMFHQVEGLVVDRGITMAHLKGLLTVLLKRLFGPSTAMRFRPHYFPFTEPSAEVDIACQLCRGRGCSVCGQTGWVEVLGCGMVHPNVLRRVGYRPREVTGFAFGLGIERLAMLRAGIPDIRLFFENDARFLEQVA